LTGTSSGIWVFKRGKKIAELERPIGLDESVERLLVFGTWIVGCCANRLEVWKNATYEHYTTIMPSSGSHGGSIFSGVVCNMPTLLNKVFVGKTDGALDIWNVSTGYVVIYHSFVADTC
jgi:U3 small nucleolar RNA-associated protein 21